MKIINKTGFPIKIKECGVDKIIPFDYKVYVVHDSCYEGYKDLFKIVEMPKAQTKPPEKKSKETVVVNDTRPLAGKRVILDWRTYPNKKECQDTRKKKVKFDYNRQHKWEFINLKTNEKITDMSVKEFCKKMGYRTSKVYNYYNANINLDDWKIIRK